MKKFICILALCLSVSAFAQKTLSKDYDFKVSQPYKVFDANMKYYFTRENEAMSVKFNGAKIAIQKFDTQKPALIKQNDYEKVLPKNYHVEDVLDVNGAFYIFFSSWNGDDDKEQLFAQQIDFATGEFTGTPKLLFQVNGKVTALEKTNKTVDANIDRSSFFMNVPAVPDKFEILQSFDKKNILVQYRKRPEVKRDVKSYDIIGLYAFDGSLNKISGKELKMPYTERRMNNIDYQVDNNGTLYMLTKVFHDDSNAQKKKKNDTIANYHIELFTIKSGAEKIDISKFENNNRFVNKIWIFDTNTDYLVCGGLYSNGKGMGTTGIFGGDPVGIDDADGLLVFKISKDGAMYDYHYYDIPVEILNQFENEDVQRTNKKNDDKGEVAKFLGLELKDLNVQNDGSIILVGEQTYSVPHMAGTSSGYTSFHYADILATKINADGKLAWMKKIPKAQKGVNGKGGMSYKYFNANNGHYFVFLDNVKNIDLSLDKSPAEHLDGKGGYLTAVKITDADGKLTKGSILNAKEVADYKIYQFSTNRIFKTSEKAFMFEAYKKAKEDIVIRIDLNK